VAVPVRITGQVARGKARQIPRQAAPASLESAVSAGLQAYRCLRYAADLRLSEAHRFSGDFCSVIPAWSVEPGVFHFFLKQKTNRTTRRSTECPARQKSP